MKASERVSSTSAASISTWFFGMSIWSMTFFRSSNCFCVAAITRLLLASSATTAGFCSSSGRTSPVAAPGTTWPPTGRWARVPVVERVVRLSPPPVTPVEVPKRVVASISERSTSAVASASRFFSRITCTRLRRM